ncbi:hypothetical protein STXM2123_335 [Streptomyces sp. F-3]|nr:hypothetical protein STXM2123_335 [Streptomyces sp. F-3]
MPERAEHLSAPRTRADRRHPLTDPRPHLPLSHARSVCVTTDTRPRTGPQAALRAVLGAPESAVPQENTESP